MPKPGASPAKCESWAISDPPHAHGRAWSGPRRSGDQVLQCGTELSREELCSGVVEVNVIQKVRVAPQCVVIEHLGARVGPDGSQGVAERLVARLTMRH